MGRARLSASRCSRLSSGQAIFLQPGRPMGRRDATRMASGCRALISAQRSNAVATGLWPVGLGASFSHPENGPQGRGYRGGIFLHALFRRRRGRGAGHLCRTRRRRCRSRLRVQQFHFKNQSRIGGEVGTDSSFTVGKVRRDKQLIF
jgi:hypothetical protein